MSVQVMPYIALAEGLPTRYRLRQNTPNPFNVRTVIPYDLPEASAVTLTLYTLAGQPVATLLSTHQGAGHHEVSWDGGECATGVYLYRIQTPEFVYTRRMLLLR